MAGEMTPDEALEKHRMHAAVALVLGFNDMAGRAETLGEKVYYRLARDHANDDAKALGVEVSMGHEQPTLLTLPGGPPWVRFRETDIEMMRVCVVEHDAKKVKP